jgi:hypothetical protein
MRSDDTIHFHFQFRGITAEITGERTFVEEMYRALMRDMEVARRGVNEDHQDMEYERSHPVVWVQRCSDMMRKIYMATPEQLELGPLNAVLDRRALANVYVDKKVFDSALPHFAEERTMWAQLTDEGRQQINRASKS